MPDETTSVSGPTAALGACLELDLALGDLLGSRIQTHIRAGKASREVAPSDLHDALRTLAGDENISPRVRRLAADLAACVERALRGHPGTTRICMTLEPTENR